MEVQKLAIIQLPFFVFPGTHTLMKPGPAKGAEGWKSGAKVAPGQDEEKTIRQEQNARNDQDF